MKPEDVGWARRRLFRMIQTDRLHLHLHAIKAQGLKNPCDWRVVQRYQKTALCGTPRCVRLWVAKDD